MSINIVAIRKSDYKKIIALEEGHFLDLKAIDIKPAKLTNAISAFANADGGELYVGIAEDKTTKTRYWKGFNNVEAANGHLQVFNELFPLGQEFAYEFLSYFNSLVLHVEIQKTLDIKIASNGKPYIRIGAQNIPVDSEENLTRLKRNKGLVSFEEETTCADISDITNSQPIIQFINEVVPRNDPDKWLKKQKLIRGDKPTVCGVLLFADEPQAILPKRCGIKICRYKTQEAEGRRETLAFTPITIEGWVYKQIKFAVDKTVKLIEENRRLGDGGLENIFYPLETLHEIITNAVLHRDYSIADDIHIRIYDNRLEVESFGQLPGHITVKNILDERFARNGNLVRIINKFPDPPNKDIGEGLNTAFRAMQQLRLKDPVIEQFNNKVIVYIYHERLASPEEAIIDYLEKNSSIKIAHARKICYIDSDHRMRRILQGLVDKNIIERVPELRGSASAYRKCEDPEIFNYDLTLRNYQIHAIKSIEAALKRGQQKLLVSMAENTGKTIISIVLLYRILKNRQFRKVLVLVDRTELVKQKINAFRNCQIENLQNFSEIFEVKELKSGTSNQSSRVDICTIQSFIRRFQDFSDTAASSIIEQYDCIVMDECYRIGWKNIAHLLERFDAVKLWLTPTPTLQAIEIFGEPIYTYSYREAVIDGWLVDHEIFCIRPNLWMSGLLWNSIDAMEFLGTKTKPIELAHIPNEVELEIEQFNRWVITEEFNRIVCEELAKHIDPRLPEKTLIFCTTDNHAELVVNQLQIALENQYGSVDKDAVVKITGNTPKLPQLIDRFHYELNPKIAVTVDLLTTGVSIPAICNLVFLRRVSSPILYDQMLGRATSRCDEIGKEVFRVFDTVDLYSAMASGTGISPVGVNPNVSFSQLVGELETTTDPGALQTILDQLLAKLQRKQRSLTNVDKNSIETLIQMPFEDIAARLRSGSPTQAVQWLRDRADIIQVLDGQVKQDVVLESPSHYVITESHQAYLHKFNTFVHENLNKIPALLLVTRRPQELTRSQLKELRSLMDTAGYSEQGLQDAWRDMTNNDIAASILGFIRQATLEEPLIPYSERVDGAMNKLLTSQSWTEAQSKWLERIGQQLKVELIVDRDALDRGQFRVYGGFERINTIFEGRLEKILREINDALWQEPANK